MFNMHIYWDTLLSQYFIPWFQNLTVREQRVVSITGILLPLCLLIVFVVLPMQVYKQRLQLEVNTLQMQVYEADQLASHLQQHGERSPIADSLLTRVDQIARKHAIRKYMTRIKPQESLSGDERLLIQMKNTPYKTFVSFMSALGEQAIQTLKVQVQAADAPGFVHVRIMIMSPT